MKANIYTGLVDGKLKEVRVNGNQLLCYWEQPGWGYTGRGPARVAEEIIVNEFGPQRDNYLINRFLEDKIAKLPGREGWQITSQDIQVWREGLDE